MRLTPDERRERRPALLEPVPARHRPLRLGGLLRGHQGRVGLDADRRQEAPLIGLQAGQAGALREDPVAELLALEHRIDGQLRLAG
ncbi:hypothetical protein ACIF6L_31965 [Kitasatospora sp. NPDC086009]|uniref:hypothetical protein n=1 Tax=unclassified Kitasatospora TaxID=2633591 RepID=UPI0037C8CB97